MLTYYDRVKNNFDDVQDLDTKALCADLLKFIERCAETSKARVLDFTDKKCEEQIGKFILDDREFSARILDNFSKFSTKGFFDLLSRENAAANKNSIRSRALIKAIEKHCYQTLCLAALYCPLELQQASIAKFCSFLYRHQLDTLFGPVELTAWTALLLLINPVKLKQQCDGSVEVFLHFSKALSPPSSPARVNNQISPNTWANHCLKGTLQLGLGIAIKYARNSLGLGIPHDLDEIELVNESIKNMALEFLLAFVVQTPSFGGGEEFAFSVELIDSILKNFICCFPNKIVEMYNLCEEELHSLAIENHFRDYAPSPSSSNGFFSLFGGETTQKQQNNNHPPMTRAPNFAHLHFKTLLELISALYESEKCPQLVQLSEEFTNPNCDGLCDFIYRGKAISAPALKVAYLAMLRSLCKTAHSAEVFYNIFR